MFLDAFELKPTKEPFERLYNVGEMPPVQVAETINTDQGEVYIDWKDRVAADRINDIAAAIHFNNLRWWHDPATGQVIERNVGEMLMLSVSELAEAMEGHRKKMQDNHLPHRAMFEVELADCIIRIMDIANGLGYDIGNAIMEKCNYNKIRQDHTDAARLALNGKSY